MSDKRITAIVSHRDQVGEEDFVQRYYTAEFSMHAKLSDIAEWAGGDFFRVKFAEHGDERTTNEVGIV